MLIFPSVIVDDLDVECLASTPKKTNAPSIVDANTVLTLAAAFQSFESIPWRDSQIIQPPCLMQIQELSPGDPLEHSKSANRLIIEERFGISALERADHVEISLSRNT